MGVNNAKLSEALESVKELARTIYSTSDKGSSHEDLAERIVEIVSAALEAPATTEKSSAVGDAAKMREALEKCATMGEQIDDQLGSSDETVYAFRDERCLAHNISECARAALAAPARNCDRFDGETEAMVAFLNEKWLVGVADLKEYPFCEWSNVMKVRYAKWLLDPSTEMGGGNK